MNEKLTIEFTDKDPKNHSVRWNADSKDSPISSMYIGKGAGAAFNNAKKIRVTAEVIE